MCDVTELTHMLDRKGWFLSLYYELQKMVTEEAKPLTVQGIYMILDEVNAKYND